MNQRLSYLDSLRGIVMLMVVLCHTCGDFCLDCKVSTWVGRIFGIVMLLYRFCYFYQDVLSEKIFVGRQLCMIGRNTLPIYLIHYFFFLGLKLPMVGEWLDVSSLWFAKIIVAFIMTLLIAYASIGVLKVVAISKPLAKILLGK